MAVGTGHGERDLLRTSAAIREWAAVLTPVAQRYLGSDAMPISALWFDKLPAANWQVPWHQDLVAPLATSTAPHQTGAAPDWGPWSTKAGVPYVQLPEPWSSRRIAMRLALDPCGVDNGPLEILTGTHRAGVLTPDAITAAARKPALPILMAAGELLVMHPLLLHRSRPAYQPGHRRVIHIEWCDVPLPGGKRWLDGSA